jgi:hypothetical protein
MQNRRLDLYWFGETGKYDRWSPAYVCAQEHADEILYQIACHQPFELSSESLAGLLGVEGGLIQDTVDALLMIGAIEQSNTRYRICFPTFLQEDVVRMRAILSDTSVEVGEMIISMKDQLYAAIRELRCINDFCAKRILYHVICDAVFDGTAFDFFEEKKLFCTGKPQAGNRDYLIIGYEACEAVTQNSKMLLCSSNNYHRDGICYNSFGDSNGRRVDPYCLSRTCESSPGSLWNVLSPESADLLLSSGVPSTISACSSFLKKAINGPTCVNGESGYGLRVMLFLQELGYVKCADACQAVKLQVPVFREEDHAVIGKISEMVLRRIYPVVQHAFEDFSNHAGSFAVVRHGVDIRELGNELWHQIFGSANEYLVGKEFVATPEQTEGQGRYLKSISVE